MNEGWQLAQRTIRWTVDCWFPGCGWSKVGWYPPELAAAATQHQEEAHQRMEPDAS